MPQPPAFGAQYPPPPVSGAPYQPTSGSPYQPPQPGPDPAYQPGQFSAPPAPDQGYQQPYPPTSGGPYPPPPGGGGYPPAGPGYGFTPAPAKSGAKPVIIIVAIVAVVALICCIGGIVALVSGVNRTAKEISQVPLPTSAPDTRPTSSSNPSGQNFNLSAGDTLTINEPDGTLAIKVTQFRTSTKGCKSYSPDPKKGMYLIADVTATVQKGNMSINPFYFNWVADDGTTTNGIAGAFAGCGDLLASGVNLPEGTTRTGSVTFDVSDKNGSLEYRHKLRAAGAWKP
ncbi:hypothetical protein [Micromonospora sp. DT233]|uniref:hypothetical protein n=1 Tax=Micromonospora sp. DT233 TaxID=3393432 RepID=UPI003CEF5E10